MPDTINAKNSDAKFVAHPDGQFVAMCVDTIDLGEKVEDFPGTPKKLSHKCALVFRTGQINEQTGDPIDIAREFTVSMGELSNLRKFLEQWRGKAYRPEQVDEGVPLHKLVGQYGLISVDHKLSAKGRTYAIIVAIVSVPAMMHDRLPSFAPYERADYWQTRREEYAAAAKQLRSEYTQKTTAGDEFEDFPGALQDENDDLPF